MPLLREGTAIGSINIRRTEILPFSDKQIALLGTFASQAVIAIENVRLFKELQDRNSELREALEHQTATSEVLSIISRSPTDVQPVLDAIVESAARVCGIDDVTLRLRDRDAMILRSQFGPMPIGRIEISVDEPQYRWIREHGALHIPDIRAQNDFPMMGSTGDYRTCLAAPLRQQGELIGYVAARRTEVRPFSSAQIKLLETFADQAVIAIENVRLFNELKESLEQQTATSEILGVIASSPTDIEPVFQTILANAVRLCEAQNGVVFRFDGAVFRSIVRRDVSSALQKYVENVPLRPGRESAVRRVGLEKRPVHIPDILADPECVVPEAYREEGMRTSLAVPLLKENNLIGAIAIWRREVRPFTDVHIKLVSTLADQAVIAIENVRLFKELQERNRDLTEALEQQTATSEVLKVISRSTFDLKPVLETLTENAVRLCGAERGSIYRFDGERLNHALSYNATPELLDFLNRNPITPGRYSVAARAALERRTIHVPDVQADREYTFGAPEVENVRTVLGVPMMRGHDLVGVFSIRNSKVQPFTDKQIDLVTTFADQAVIAIENVRLFQELKESLEQQTATSEILGVIASSPTDIQPVLDAVAESAARLCQANDAVIRLVQENVLRLAAHHGSVQGLAGERPIDRFSPTGRAVVERQIIHIEDILSLPAAEN